MKLFSDRKTAIRQTTSEKTKTHDSTPKLQEISCNETSTDSEASCDSEARPITKEKKVPVFEVDEVALGHFLGDGSFGCVREVVAFQVEDEGYSSSSPEEDETTRNPLDDKKAKLADSVFSNGQPRYASKKLRSSKTTDSQDVLFAMDDLAWEASVLSQLQHPNVIDLHAIAGRPRTSSFCLILDKLDLTLDTRIQEWKRARSPIGRGIRGLRRDSSSSLESIWKEQLHIALAMARAVRCLHQYRIVFRDLKPENCGVADDTWKLFDFGLCRTLEPQHMIRSPDGYQATGMVGTPRYMAPEVFCNQLYGFSADAHSFGMFLWSMFAMEVPFSYLHSRADFETQVMRGGKRPPTLKRKLVPRAEVQQWMQRCWDPRPTKRPNFHATCRFLEKQLDALD